MQASSLAVLSIYLDVLNCSCGATFHVFSIGNRKFHQGQYTVSIWKADESQSLDLV